MIRLPLVSALLAATLWAAPMTAAAQTPPAPSAADAASPAAQARLQTRVEEVAAVLLGRKPAAEVFAPEFLAQVPAAKLAGMQAQLTGAYGALSPGGTVTAKGDLQGEFVLRFAKANVRGPIILAPAAPHLVTGLQIAAIDPVNDSAAAVSKDLSALPGTVNAWFGPLAGGAPRLALNADRPLALGSAFKLYVLSSLQRRIAAGELSWEQVVPLTARSFPSGLTQDWPAGTPVTVQSLATLMMQISDNTATDQLIALVGRDAVEAEFRRTAKSAGATLPFLTTREMFAIKSDPAFRARYAAAGERERRTLLADLPNPSLAQVTAVFAGAPVAIDSIEWFATPAELAELLKGFTGDDTATVRGALTAAKGMSPEIVAKWDYVGFKGGSEPGVLNLTWLLRDKAGAWHMATLGWNDPAAPVDQTRLVALANRMLALAE